MKHFLLAMLAITILTSIPAKAFAGNQTNSASSGNVTGMIVCVIEEGFSVDETSMAIDSDACFLQFAQSTLEELRCAEGDDCSYCLSTLKRYGMTVTQSNAYKGGEEGEFEELAYHLVEGNAGPFLDRLGTCPD